MVDPPQPDSPFDSAFLKAYEELRYVARAQRRNSAPLRRDHHTTSLVHEAFIRLRRSGAIEFHDDHHLLRIAARAIRHFVIDNARRSTSAKRGSGQPVADLDRVLPEAQRGEYTDLELLALDEALARLHELDKRKAEIVELRFFGGASNAQIAEITSTSTATVAREWRVARAWLYQELGTA